MAKKPPRFRYEITIEHNGKPYTGSYTVQSGIVTVDSMYGRKSTQVGGSDAERIARLMLGELVIQHGTD